jgi:hypothetical protein
MPRTARRVVAGFALATASLVATVATVAPASASTPAPRPVLATSSAVVIVDTGDSVHRQVISFDGSVSGLGALQLAGANPVTVDFGGSLGEAVCKLYGVGDEPLPGDCPNGWRYYRAAPGASGFSFSSSGPSNTTVQDGGVEGWGYGHAPAFASFCEVAGCAPPPPPPPPPQAGAPPPVVTSSPNGGAVASGGTGSTTVPGAIPTTPGEPTPPSTGSSAGPTTTTRSDRGGRTARNDHDGRLASSRSKTPPSDSGSPASFIMFVVVMAVLVAGAVVIRRSRRRPAD